eukprot:CAMPEP_0201573580 /NCGR_PEP_ID=MMETSP0190_2-20130828/17526_1 /ASSEMBLY_ACC=CAM_ASM_000263 /TAXON_ID=37353 /ORGANISM="Rosalina sp." /LENGTH=116 /DNA_ID=CAMNT_0048000729 /DNA_START=642 /DNA_END=992 /DNA_ORIENTATION=+
MTKSNTSGTNDGNTRHPMDTSSNIGGTTIKIEDDGHLMMESGFTIVETPMSDNENDDDDQDEDDVDLNIDDSIGLSANPDNNHNDEYHGKTDTLNLNLNELNEVLDNMEKWQSTPL